MIYDLKKLVPTIIARKLYLRAGAYVRKSPGPVSAHRELMVRLYLVYAVIRTLAVSNHHL